MTRRAGTRATVADRTGQSGPDGGNVSLLFVGVLAVLVTVLAGLAAVGAAAVTAHRARSAADLAALAGAQRGQATGNPGAACPTAQAVAAANGATLRACLVHNGDVEVTVTRQLPLPSWLPGTTVVQAAARAGPRRGGIP